MDTPAWHAETALDQLRNADSHLHSANELPQFFMASALTHALLAVASSVRDLTVSADRGR